MGSRVVVPIGQGDVEVGVETVAAHRDEAAASSGRPEGHLDGVRAVREGHVIAVGRAALRVVLDDVDREGAGAELRLETRLDIAQHQRALEPGADDPGQVVRPGTRHAENPTGEGPHMPCHSRQSSTAGLSSMTEPRIPVAAPSLGAEEMANVMAAVSSGWILARGVHRAVRARLRGVLRGRRTGWRARSNGTVALHLALVAAGVGPGDEVLVPDLTFVATANVVRYTRRDARASSTPSRARGASIRPTSRRRSRRARGPSSPVHLYGHPVDMDPLLALARRARAGHRRGRRRGARRALHGPRVGALGDDRRLLSFYGNKIITTGEGGMVVTNDDAAGRARCASCATTRWTRSRRYWHPGDRLQLPHDQHPGGDRLRPGRADRTRSSPGGRRSPAPTTSRPRRDAAGLTPPPAEPWARERVLDVLGDPEPTRRSRSTRSGAAGRSRRRHAAVLPPRPHAAAVRDRRAPARRRAPGARGINLPSGTGLTRDQVERVARRSPRRWNERARLP